MPQDPKLIKRSVDFLKKYNIDCTLVSPNLFLTFDLVKIVFVISEYESLIDVHKEITDKFQDDINIANNKCDINIERILKNEY